MTDGIVRTVSGDEFCPFKNSMGNVEIGDIAWSLAHQCRYNGHVDRFYSVANHCLVMCRYFELKGDKEKALEALLHDASEAYLGDMVQPIKALLPDIVALENRIQGYILKQLGHLDRVENRNGVDVYVMSSDVHELDRRMVPHETAILRSSIKNGNYDVSIGDLYDAPPDMLAGMYEMKYEQLTEDW